MSVEHITIDELVKRHVLAVLEDVGGNKSKAARILGMDRRTLYRRLHEWGVELQPLKS